MIKIARKLDRRHVFAYQRRIQTALASSINQYPDNRSQAGNYPVTSGNTSPLESQRARQLSTRPISQQGTGGRATGLKYGGLLAAILGSVGVGVYLRARTVGKSHCKEAPPAERQAGARRPDLPDFRKAEISKHRTASSDNNKIWVTYRDGVYDITDFIAGHPGGDKILLAGGGPLEPFWRMYAVHKSPEVYEMLEELRIGNIHPDDKKLTPDKVADASDPYANEPERHPAFTINSATPFNSEPPVQLLIDSFLTPNELFFVRNHLPVPKVDVKKFQLEVSGLGIKKPVSLSVSDLRKKFKQHTVVAAVQCAGNRRSNMRAVREVKGLNWGTCAIGNASWTGVKLSDVLEYAGASEEKVKHVLFQGLDQGIDKSPYEASIPAESAFDPRKDVLLAFEMNGEELPVDHGYPLRVVVPGTVGARQVKWLSKIILSDEESSSHWQKNDYKVFNSSTDWHNVDFSKAEPIQEYPLQSSICEPTDGATVEPGDDLVVKGYAWSGGGRGILRVDVSLDGGKTWHVADLEKADQRRHREWAWTLWSISLPVSAEARKGDKLEVICKAMDTSHNAQPESAESIWNLRGLIHNAWHRVNVTVN